MKGSPMLLLLETSDPMIPLIHLPSLLKYQLISHCLKTYPVPSNLKSSLKLHTSETDLILSSLLPNFLISIQGAIIFPGTPMDNLQVVLASSVSLTLPQNQMSSAVKYFSPASLPSVSFSPPSRRPSSWIWSLSLITHHHNHSSASCISPR